MRRYKSLKALLAERQQLYLDRKALEEAAEALAKLEKALDAQAAKLFKSSTQKQIVSPEGFKLTQTTAPIATILSWPKLLQAVGEHADDEAWQAVLHKRLSPTAIETLLQVGVTVPGAVLEYLRVVRFSAPRKKRS